jgi:hypothetical protein
MEMKQTGGIYTPFGLQCRSVPSSDTTTTHLLRGQLPWPTTVQNAELHLAASMPGHRERPGVLVLTKSSPWLMVSPSKPFETSDAKSYSVLSMRHWVRGKWKRILVNNLLICNG